MKIVFADWARKKFLKLDKPVQKQIQAFIIELQGMQEPLSCGEALSGNLARLLRYRVGECRLICMVKDDEILITALHDSQ